MRFPGQTSRVQMLPKTQRVTKRRRQLATANVKLAHNLAHSLAHSEERFRRLVDALPDAIYVQSDDRLVFVNPFGMRLLGAQEPGQLIGKRLSEIVHPSHLAKIKRRNQRCYRTGAASPAEEVLLCALDGSLVSVEALVIPITWDGGPAIEVVARDISERKRAQQRLQEYEKTVEGLEEMIAVVDRGYRYVLANRAFLNYRGLEREEVVGHLVSDVLDKEIFEKNVRHRLVECFQGKVVKYELRYPYFAVGERDLFVTYFPIEGPDGVDRVACVVQDITDRKRAEQTLQEWQKRLYLAQKAGLRIGLWDWDVVAGTVTWSDEIYRQFGLTADTFTGRVADAVVRIHPEDRPGVEGEIEKILGGAGSEFAAQYRAMRPDGTTCWVDAHGVVVRNKSTHMLGIGIDVTERKRSQHCLQEAQRELARVSRVATMGELTASIAHEINQPLAAIATDGSAAVRWLAAHPPNLEEAREAATRAVREANRAAAVIGRIRALLKKTSPITAPLDINAVIREVLALNRHELVRGDVRVQTKLAAAVPNVLGDRVQLQQVMLNLIMNAIDAMSTIMDRSRKLLIKSAKSPHGVLIRVEDSGIGLDPAHQEDRIFEPFFTTKPEGIGMGLSISRSIIEAHGGRLWAASGAEHGAVFQFSLPGAGGNHG